MKIFIISLVLISTIGITLFYICFYHGSIKLPEGKTYDDLVNEAIFFAESVKDSDELYYTDSNFPPIIKSFKPQYVAVFKGEPNIVELQIRGGFFHYGLIVVCKKNDNEIIPHSHWRVKRLAESVFEFRE